MRRPLQFALWVLNMQFGLTERPVEAVRTAAEFSEGTKGARMYTQIDTQFDDR